MIRDERIFAAALVAVSVFLGSMIIAGGGFADTARRGLEWQTVENADLPPQADASPKTAAEEVAAPFESYRPKKETSDLWRDAYSALESRVTDIERTLKVRSGSGNQQVTIEAGRTSSTPFPGVPIWVDGREYQAASSAPVVYQQSSGPFQTVCTGGQCRQVQSQVARPVQRLWRRY
jgi:hypothetical protein